MNDKMQTKTNVPIQYIDEHGNCCVSYEKVSTPPYPDPDYNAYWYDNSSVPRTQHNRITSAPEFGLAAYEVSDKNIDSEHRSPHYEGMQASDYAVAANEGLVEKFSKLMNGMISQYRRKNAAYGNSFGTSVERYGPISALTRMSDKWNRLENLMLNKGLNDLGESVDDTLIDLATYCVMTVMALHTKDEVEKIVEKLEGTR